MPRSQGYPGFAWAVLGLCLLVAPAASAQELIDCPAPTSTPGHPQPTISHQMFSDVCFLNPDRFGPVPAPILFDDFAWRSFLALVWPSWNEYGGTLPCEIPGDPTFGDMILAAYAKFDSVLQANAMAFSGALVSQNGKYVRYSSGFNKTLFQHIADGKLFIAKDLHDHFTPFPAASIRVKAAWIEMEGIEKPERFHTRQAWLLDRATNRCERKQVGLVGLHRPGAPVPDDASGRLQC